MVRLYIGACLLIWASLLWAGRELIHIGGFPDRWIVMASWRIVAWAVAAGALFLVGAIGYGRAREAQAATGSLAMAARLFWLPGFLLVSLLPYFGFPTASAALIVFGAPVLIAWAWCAGLEHSGRAGRLVERLDRHAGVAIFVVFTLAYTIIGVYFTKLAGEHAGDEGHYLIQARSLYEDLDLDIRNQFEDPDNTPFHGSPNSRGDAWYPRHAPGIAVLLAPTVPLGLWARHAVLAAVAALALVGCYRLACFIGARKIYTLSLLLIFGGGLYWGIYASRALPETLGALLAIWALWACLWQLERPWTATLLSWACVSYMPWAQTRFIPIAGIMILLFGAHALFVDPKPFRRKLARLTIYTLCCVASMALYQYVQWRLYHGGEAYSTPSLLFSLPAGMWHTLASERGILYALPLFACALAALAWGLWRRESRLAALYTLVLFASVFLTSSATIWFTGGATVAGRFLLVTLPAFLAMLAKAMGERGRGFRLLTLYTGIVMVGGFIAMLTVLGEIGRYFADPFVLTRFHGIIGVLPNFYYEPYTSIALGPALYLYLIALVLLLLPRRVSPWVHRAAFVVLALVYVRYASFARQEAHNPLRTARTLQRINKALPPLILVRGDVSTPVPLLAHSNLFAREDPWSLKGVTTERLARRVQDGWISVPHIELNDWDNRPYRWATLLTPFRPGRGHFVIVFEGQLSEQSGGVLHIREGAHNRRSFTYEAGAAIREVIDMETRNTGDLYVLFRFTGDEGRLETRRIMGSVYAPGVLEKANIQVGAGDGLPVLDATVGGE